MKTLMCSDGISITELNNGTVQISIDEILLLPIKGESEQDMWKRIEESLYQLSDKAYGWHSEWEYTNSEEEEDDE